MRRFLALVRSATLDALAEPLSAVLLLAALLTVHVAPVFHFHEFGEPGRLARECGFSALLVFGLVFATAAAVRSVGGEIASGTAAVALARPVPRALFLCGKIAGVCAAFAVFLFAVACAAVLATHASAVGARVAACCAEEETSRIWMPGLVAGTCATIGAFALAALANRFLGMRFCVWACRFMALAQPLAIVAALPFSHEGLWISAAEMPWSILPAMGVLAAGCGVFVVFAGALSVRLRPAPTAALVAAGVASSFVWPLKAVLPEIARFWLVDALAYGGALPWSEAASALSAAACLVVLWLLAGVLLFQGRELP